eukprot:TRINITY_DN18273_c0_g1_i1.p1 TRINITY_DN18273_c0_g1~~TRINITY_DN18273_c0_g1_i1.p1  ORF type:complete len:554 (+),score=53.51 TRINITY_DN18273_c0_g1_i1:32-1693(+)
MNVSDIIEKYSLYSQPRVHDRPLLTANCCLKVLQIGNGREWDDDWIRAVDFLTSEVKSGNLSVEQRVMALKGLSQSWKAAGCSEYVELFDLLIFGFTLDEYTQSVSACSVSLYAMLMTGVVYRDIVSVICESFSVTSTRQRPSLDECTKTLSGFARIMKLRPDVIATDEVTVAVRHHLLPVLYDELAVCETTAVKDTQLGTIIDGMASLNIINLGILRHCKRHLMKIPCGSTVATFILVALSRAEYYDEDLVSHLLLRFFSTVDRTNLSKKQTAYNLCISLTALVESDVRNRQKLFLRCLNYLKQPAVSKHLTVKAVMNLVRSLKRLRYNLCREDPVSMLDLVHALTSLFPFIEGKKVESHEDALGFVLCAHDLRIDHPILQSFVPHINVSVLTNDATFALANALTHLRIGTPETMLPLLEKAAAAVPDLIHAQRVKQMFGQTISGIQDGPHKELINRINNVFLSNPRTRDMFKTARSPSEFRSKIKKPLPGARPGDMGRGMGTSVRGITPKGGGFTKHASSIPINQALKYFSSGYYAERKRALQSGRRRPNR